MDDEWAGSGWSEEKEQAFQDLWAIRILTCPKTACRRGKRCTDRQMPSSCPGIAAHPFPATEDGNLLRLLRFALLRRLAEIEAGEEATRTICAAREAAAERRQALAWERARAWVKENPARRRGGK